ncbi:MAG: hypothetical protein P8L66_05255 [Rhodospirillaceae bacterium]|jgi:hypothetical protein|nr:hypothetical protein [Rhodospirillaceae bacterium]
MQKATLITAPLIALGVAASALTRSDPESVAVEANSYETCRLSQLNIGTFESTNITDT